MKLLYKGRAGKVYKYNLDLVDGAEYEVSDEVGKELLELEGFEKAGPKKPKNKPKEEGDE